ATWFVRADAQLRDVYGSAAYPVESQSALWASLAESGDEIGWHPHLYRRRADGTYMPETVEDRQVAELRDISADLRNRGVELTSSRMGEAVGSNGVMQELDRLGMTVDSSAIPGRKRSDASRCFDWEGTPNTPYHPSIHDYRVSVSGAKRTLVEVPMTTVPVRSPTEA